VETDRDRTPKPKKGWKGQVHPAEPAEEKDPDQPTETVTTGGPPENTNIRREKRTGEPDMTRKGAPGETRVRRRKAPKDRQPADREKNDYPRQTGLPPTKPVRSIAGTRPERTGDKQTRRTTSPMNRSTGEAHTR
jgi:hypothetical protein